MIRPGLITARPVHAGDRPSARVWNTMLEALRAGDQPYYSGRVKNVLVTPLGIFERSFEIGTSTSLISVVVTGHGTPYADSEGPGEVGRIYTHLGGQITVTDHVTACYSAAAAYEFSALQPGGWFHPGQIVTLWEAASGVYKADCRYFLGEVTELDLEGDPAGGQPRGLVEVTPFDGDPGYYPDHKTGHITLFPGSKVYRAAQFPGAGLTYGEPVLCIYVGQPGRMWMAMSMPNLFGSAYLADGSLNPDYANGSPPADDLCPVGDPDLPADVVDGTLTAGLSEVGACG